MSFADNLNRIMKRNRLNYKTLADLIGCSPQAVCQWRMGTREPQANSIVRLCKAMDCSADELLGLKDGR